MKDQEKGEDIFKKELGERFKILTETLLKRKIATSIGQIASFMETKSQAVSQILHNSRLPTLKQINKLSHSTGFNPNWLINGEDSMFLPEKKEVDIIVMITKSINNGLIDKIKGEEIIEYIRQLQNEVNDRDQEIKSLLKK